MEQLQFGVSQENFLTHVAQALGREQPSTTAPERSEVGPPAFWKEDEPIKGKMLELFVENLETLGGRVYLAKTRDEVSQKLIEWLKELEAKKAICWNDEELKNILETSKLPIEVYYWDANQHTQEELIQLAAQAQVGITWVNYAIAYTGTMAVFSGTGSGRSVSLLPPTHIAIFSRKQLVPTMSTVMRDLIELHGTDKLPSGVSFITGPSRTSDIEMDLSIGVHGPYRTWVVIVDE